MEKLYGLIGEKLGHSFSSNIHSSIFSEMNIKGYYHLFEVKRENLKDVVVGLNALGIEGANVTIPYKVDIMKYLDKISEEAKQIGAVNTICIKDGKTVGYNTDYYGFGMMLEKYNVDIKNRKVVILGTGGVSKAVTQYLIDNEVDNIIFVSRNPNKIKVNGFKVIGYDEIKLLEKQDIVINCTPCGMYPDIDTSPITKEGISKFKIVIDMIYNPRETMFLKYAKVIYVSRSSCKSRRNME